MIDAATLRSLLGYDPATGNFTRLNGVKAGGVNSLGYVQIRICGARYKAHRLAWLYVYGEWPKGFIDHINGIRDDNRIVNLRIATHKQNMANSRLRVDAKMPKGVTMIHGARYRALIRVDGVLRHIGYFPTEEQARIAYCEAAQKEFGAYHRAG